MSARATTLAVDLGGTNMRAALVEAGGQVLDRHEVPTPHDGRGPEALVELMTKVIAENPTTSPCRGAVVGVPGRVNYASGVLEHAPNLPKGWVDGLGDQKLSKTLGLPVALANDADLAAVGEAWFGAGREADDVVYLTLSTGVGAGVILGRRLVHGQRSVAEIGHTLLSTAPSVGMDPPPSTVEGAASGTALARLAAGKGLEPGGPAIVEAVRRGDPRAVAVWEQVVVVASVAAINLAWLFTPQVIVIGGGLGLVGDLLLDPLRAALPAGGPPALSPLIEIVGAALGDDAGLAGAAGWREALSTNPSRGSA